MVLGDSLIELNIVIKIELKDMNIFRDIIVNNSALVFTINNEYSISSTFYNNWICYKKFKTSGSDI